MLPRPRAGAGEREDARVRGHRETLEMVRDCAQRAAQRASGGSRGALGRAARHRSRAVRAADGTSLIVSTRWAGGEQLRVLPSLGSTTAVETPTVEQSIGRLDRIGVASPSRSSTFVPLGDGADVVRLFGGSALRDRSRARAAARDIEGARGVAVNPMRVSRRRSSALAGARAARTRSTRRPGSSCIAILSRRSRTVIRPHPTGSTR